MTCVVVTSIENRMEENKTRERRTETPLQNFFSNLEVRFLKHRREQMDKAISKSFQKEEIIDAVDDVPEMKDVRRWRQQAKRKTLLKKRDTIEEKIRLKEQEEENKREKVFEEVDSEDEETESSDSFPEMGLIPNLKIQFLEHQRHQILKTISKTYEKEAEIEDEEEESPEQKEIRMWRQQGKRKKLLKKQQALEERILDLKEKNLRKRTEENEEEEEEEKERGFFRVMTVIFTGYGEPSMAFL